MGQIYCQVSIPHRSLLSRDTVVNTFTFSGVDNVEDQATIALGKLAAFYNAESGTQNEPLKNFYSGELRLDSCRIKVYDLSDPEPRVPILDESLGVTSPAPLSTTNLPGEVAVCASYSGPPESGEPNARRRGRIYLGPLNQGASTGTGVAPARPSTSFIGNIAEACKELSDGPVGTQWSVWSRRNNNFVQIDRGYVDNSFDTQRRRGVDTTARTGWEGGLG